MILKITKKADPVWKKKFVDVAGSTQIEKLVEDMKETLEFTQGVGLAAPQVGYPYRLFIVDYADLKEVFLNPKIVSKNTAKDYVEEGCLSIPGYRGLVERPTELTIQYTTLDGKAQEAKVSGFYARIIQHEYDHLNGTFYIDHIKKPKHLYSFDPIRIVYFGTNDFNIPSANILKSIIGLSMVGDYTIPLVVTSPDGQTRKGPKPSPVKSLAKEWGIPVLTPERLAKKVGDTFTLTNNEVYAQIKKAKPDLLVLASYGKILPKEILDLPKFAPINIHPSLLPKYRGTSPIQTAILKGDKATGVTIMKMNEKMDEGDIYIKGRYEMRGSETAETLSETLSKLGKDLLHHTIHYLVLKKIKTRPQDHSKATYTKIIKKEDGKVDFAKPPKNLERMIRAYHPWPGVWGDYNGKMLKLLPGKMVQLEGKNPVSLKNFKSGHKDFTLDW
ncbi:MAG TPA: methionyl-tRNA formyltransferase [Candidatus Saccharimonadales bacterium]|nr:methionyl-tRNA formyltransferase [Candidatus Saccharimonadales bacterium]